jgi:large subunit ribosomal protein L2
MSVSTFEEVTKTTPEKSLTEPLKRKGGRNNTAGSLRATRAAATSAATA